MLIAECQVRRFHSIPDAWLNNHTYYCIKETAKCNGSKMRWWRKKMQSFANWSIFNFAKKNNSHKRSGQFSLKNAFLLEAASKRWHLNCKRLQDDLHEIWNDATSQLWSCTGGDLLWSTLRASLLFAAAATRTVRWSSRKAKGVDNRTSGSRPYQHLPGPEVDRHPSSWHCLEIITM